MNKLEAMTARKAILAWRERWTKTINERLQADSKQLQEILNVTIDAMGFWNAVFSKSYTRKRLQPLFTQWSEAKALELTKSAATDLVGICERSVPSQNIHSALESQASKGLFVDMATATITTALAAAAIPAAVSLSTTTVSVGGVLGFLGVTATVVVLKQLILALLLVLIIWFIASNRIGKVKINAKARLKAQMQDQVQRKVLYSKKSTSLAMSLIGVIETTANKLLGELNNAR